MRTSELGGKGSGFYGNQNPPKYITGAFYPPPSFGGTATTMATTATRIYYVPFNINYSRTFAGVVTYNGGAGDNGEKIRIMMFNDDGAAGGPGTLAKDFGEITLTGASALRTLSSSWAASPGLYWGAFWAETAITMYGMTQGTVGTAVGAANGPVLTHLIGDLNGAGSGFFGLATGVVACHYVDTAYGAAPATAVAPTASLTAAWASATPVVPAFLLKA